MKRSTLIPLCLFVALAGPGSARDAAETDKEIQSVEGALKDKATWIQRDDVRIEKCRSAGYTRQERYWRVHRKSLVDARATLQLRRQVLAAEKAGEAPPAEIVQRLAEGRKPAPEAVPQQVREQFHALDLPYNRHLVRLNFMRDLIHRVRRVRFYLQEAMRGGEGGMGTMALPNVEVERRVAAMRVDGGEDPVELGPVLGAGGNYRTPHPFYLVLRELLRDTRAWAEQYGDLYFDMREHPILGEAGRDADFLARCEHLRADLADIEMHRAALEKRTLDFLKRFDADGKFGSLGIPEKRKISLQPDGRPSDLLFCIEPTAGDRPCALGDNKYPLCVDVVDWSFRPLFPKAPGVLDSEKPRIRGRLAAQKRDVENGYYFKQPLYGNSHGRTPRHIDPGLIDPEGTDKDLFLQDSTGGHGTYPNIWHPQVRDLAWKNMAAVARFCREIPNFLFYDKLTWEPLFKAGQQGSTPLLAGYGPRAVAAFRVFLRRKFGTIANLNQAWRTDYAGFDAVEPPPDPFLERRKWATPLTHEFELFRSEALAEWLTLLIDAVHKEDPGRPVAVEIHTCNANFPFMMGAPYGLMKEVPAAYIEDHYNNWYGSYTCLNLLYSLCLYAGKHPVEMEYIWTYPRLQPAVTEEHFRVTGELGFWRRVVWGRKALHAFGSFDGWGYRHNYMDERFCELGWTLGASGNLIREAGTALPVAKRRAREFWPILNATEVAKAKIAVVVPTTSMLNEYPYHSVHEAYPTTTMEMIRLERMLTPEDLDLRFVPEEVILSGEEDLEGFRVVILPYAPYFPEGLTAKLLAWTRRGGLLLGHGVPGVFDKYGFEDGTLMSEVFGAKLGFTYAGNDKVWQWALDVRSPEVATPAADADRALLVRIPYGKGAVLVNDAPLDAAPERARRRDALLNAIRGAVGRPTAESAHHSFEMVTREDGKGRRYLFLTNPDLNGAATDYVTVAGEFREIVDLGIGSRCRVPLAPREPMVVNSRFHVTSPHTDGTSFITVRSPAGGTTFQMRLEPGEATVLQLVR